MSSGRVLASAIWFQMLNLKLLEYRMGTNRPLPGTTVVSYCPLVDEAGCAAPARSVSSALKTQHQCKRMRRYR
jgi:hypothetical protein